MRCTRQAPEPAGGGRQNALEAFELTFLGTSSGSPSTTRNQQSLALRLGGETWLFDCGEATQQRMVHSPTVWPSDVRRIFVSHLHGDHCFGLPGLLCSMAAQMRSHAGCAAVPVQIVGPTGLRSWLRASLGNSHAPLGGLRLQILEIAGMWAEGAERKRPRVQLDEPLPHEIEGATLAPDADGSWAVPRPPWGGPPASVRAVELDHTVPTVGWVVDEEARPAGAARRLAILSDSRDSSRAAARAAGAHLLVHEATNACTSLDAKQGLSHAAVRRSTYRHGHSTPQMAAEFAAGIGARGLVLTHFSSRYAGDASPFARGVMAEVRELARRRYDGDVVTAEDLMTVTVHVDGSWSTGAPPVLPPNGWGSADAAAAPDPHRPPEPAEPAERARRRDLTLQARREVEEPKEMRRHAQRRHAEQRARPQTRRAAAEGASRAGPPPDAPQETADPPVSRRVRRRWDARTGTYVNVAEE